MHCTHDCLYCSHRPLTSVLLYRQLHPLKLHKSDRHQISAFAFTLLELRLVFVAKTFILMFVYELFLLPE